MEIEKDPGVIAEFKRKRKLQIYLSVPLVVIFIMFLIVINKPDAISGLSAESVVILMAVVGLIGTVITFKTWRCPACNTYLGRGMNPKICSKCGKPLQ
jgi:hypothetical protein